MKKGLVSVMSLAYRYWLNKNLGVGNLIQSSFALNLKLNEQGPTIHAIRLNSIHQALGPLWRGAWQ